MKADAIAPSEPERPALLADRFRPVHAGMIDAVLSGDGHAAANAVHEVAH
jgi:hypothetical protein